MTKLSYQLPQYDLALIKLLREIKKGLDKTHPVLSQIQNISVVHGGTTRQVSEPTMVETQMRLFSAPVSAEVEWVLRTDAGSFAELAYRMWQGFSADAEKALFEMVGKTSEAVGNVHDAHGQNIWDSQIEALKKMPLRFDKDGNHNMKFYAPPKENMGAREIIPPPEQQRRLEELFKAKREEYNAQKRTRRLS